MKKIISTDQAPSAIGPYSQAVEAGNFVFISGQLGLDAKTGDFYGVSVGQQARKVLENIGAILEAAQLTFRDVVKVTVLLADINDFAEVNEIYGEFFTEEYPARAAFQAAGLPKGGLVEIEAIACR